MAKSSVLVTVAVIVLVVLVAVAIGVPSYQGYLHRSRVTQVINELARVRALVAGDMAARPPGVPVRREFKAESPMVTRIAVDYERKSIAAFVDPDRIGHPAIPRNGSVTWTAVVDGPGLEWKCTSDIPGKFLPAACR